MSAEETAFEWNVDSIFGITIMAINILILLPLMIYFGFTFYKRSRDRIETDDETFFNRRHPSTIYATIIFSILFVGVERPLSLAIYQLNLIKLPFPEQSNSPFQFFTYALCAYGIYFTFLQRFWMVFYSYKYGLAQAKLVWKRQLNPDFDENDNFFFANVDGFGSFSMTSPCLVILWMITVILLPISVAVPKGIPFDIATFFLLTPPFLVLSYIAYRISPITDQYHIRDELILCIITMGISLFLHLLIFLCVAVPTNDEQVTLEILLGTIISSIQYTILCYIITIWVLNKNDRNHVVRPASVKLTDRESSHTQNSSFMGSFFPSYSNTTDSVRKGKSFDVTKEEKGIRKKKLYNLLKTKHGFNLFMMHLTQELSVENLLFICEYTQYKRAISKQHLKGRISGWMQSLPQKFIPTCECITKYPSDYLSQIHLIHEKYVKWGAPLELNISARRRKRILQQFDEEKQDGKVDENLMKKGWKQLSMFYDSVAVEIWKLMNDSFGRITETEKYEIWHSQLPKKIEEEEDAGNVLPETTTLNV